jgi:hypothetical protein
VTEDSILHDIPGGKALFEWFERVPNFHDASLVEISLASNGTSRMRLHAWRMTEQVDVQGYFVLDRHVVVTLTLDEVTDISLSQFNLPGIVSYLHITRAGDGFELTWDGSYGVEGTIRANRLEIDLQPGKPE